MKAMLALARRIDAQRAEQELSRFGAILPGGRQLEVAVLLATAYPALGAELAASPAATPPGPTRPRGLYAAARERLAGLDGAALRAELRRFARAERARIALCELLPAARAGADVDATAAELSELAELTVEAALAEASRHVFRRFGTPRAPDGSAGRITVLGMGKLGGSELNAGSDVDLVCFYDDDEHVAHGEGGETSAHEVWTKVVQRMVATLEEPTEHGFVWRVDLRLRPEGARGPLVDSLAAAERYYETFGRLWERAALLRARPIAGDRAFGAEVLAALAPFVWRRAVDPRIAITMHELCERARAELASRSLDARAQAGERDLKHGRGGIRQAEFFVQTLQLVWGGRHERVRVRSTLEAAARLRAAGLLGEREHDDLCAAYLALRRAEHAVQNASGVQTHRLPEPGPELERLARVLGFDGTESWLEDLAAHRARVEVLSRSLLPDDGGSETIARWRELWGALDRGDAAAFGRAVGAALGWSDDESREELCGHLYDLARAPDALLGARTRERAPALGDAVLDALADCADPVQAARYLRRFAAAVRPREVYTELLAADPRALRRLVAAFGGSAFVGEAVSTQPELADLVLFERAPPTAEQAREEVLAALNEPGDIEQLVGAMRRAKARIVTRVALADLAGEIDTRAATVVLSALADGTLEAAARLALGTSTVRGFAILAMGKLGGSEIGYGSDLDVVFLYEGGSDRADAQAHFARAAQRVIRLITTPHAEGRGYELDTRLRPSGSHGLLVSSLDAFARYHEVSDDPRPSARGERAAVWERLALLRARFAAGDPELGAAALAIARHAAYERPCDAAEVRAEVRRLRDRMEKELARERPGRYDLKLGRGGLIEIELSVQLLQILHGARPDLRTPDTRVAIEALAEAGVLEPAAADALRDGYAFLRRLEQRLRIVHGDGATLIEEGAGGLDALARRMGLSHRAPGRAAERLLSRYRAVTGRVREAYEAIVA